MEWYIFDPFFIIFDELSENEIKKFIANRNDESIISILVKIYGSIKLKDETYFLNDEIGINYPILAKRIK